MKCFSFIINTPQNKLIDNTKTINIFNNPQCTVAFLSHTKCVSDQ